MSCGANFWSSLDGAGGVPSPEVVRASPVPTWEYQVGLGRLIKRVACVPGKNAVAISYRLEGGPPVRLEMKVLANSTGLPRRHPWPPGLALSAG